MKNCVLLWLLLHLFSLAVSSMTHSGTCKVQSITKSCKLLILWNKFCIQPLSIQQMQPQSGHTWLLLWWILQRSLNYLSSSNPSFTQLPVIYWKCTLNHITSQFKTSLASLIIWYSWALLENELKNIFKITYAWSWPSYLLIGQCEA